MVNRIMLTLVFTLSFLTYVGSEITVFFQFVPLILFAVLVFLRVLWSKSVLKALGSLLEVDGLLFVFLLSVFIVGPSLASSYAKSPGIALLLAFYLILARLYMAVVPIREVLEAFFWSGMLSIGIFIPLGFSTLLQSVESLARFSPFSFHPNLLAFILAGYFCAIVWKVVVGGWRMKILAGLAGFACLVIIFFTSSRGAIVGIIAGCTIAGALEIMRAGREQRKKVLRWGFLVAVVLLGSVLYLENSESLNDAATFADQVLELTNDSRGVGSGFSGRLDRWNAVTRIFADGTFLIGKGIRYTDISENTAIDNSYLVILYEVGLLPLLLIAGRFVSILWRFVRAYFNAVGVNSRGLYLDLGLLLFVLLIINIVERYLFAVGNPYSLFAFLIFATPTSTMKEWLAEPARSSIRFANRLEPKLRTAS